MACEYCEISPYIKDNGVDLIFLTETWLSAQGGRLAGMSVLDTEVDGSNPGSSMLFP